MAMSEKRRKAPNAEVAVFVDRRAQHGAAMLPIPGRIIRAPAEQRNSKWSPADNHPGAFSAVTYSAAWAKLSGVPMSRNRPEVVKASSDPAGARCRTSRSSDPRPSRAMSRAKFSLNRYTPAFTQPEAAGPAFFSSNLSIEPDP